MREHVSTKSSKRRMYQRNGDGEQSWLPLWWQKPWLYSCCLHNFSLVKEFLQYLWQCYSPSTPFPSVQSHLCSFLPLPLHPVHWELPPGQKWVPCSVMPPWMPALVLPSWSNWTSQAWDGNSREWLFRLAGCRNFSNIPEKERRDVNKQKHLQGEANYVICVQLQQFLNSSCMAEWIPSHFLTFTFFMLFLIIS